MRQNRVIICCMILLLWVTAFVPSCKLGEVDTNNPPPPPDEETRADGAVKVAISLSGSLQNPAWSPDGNRLVFTRFRQGYNREPADIYILDLDDGSLHRLVSDGSGNINLPGSSWNAATNKIVFASTREPHDELYIIDADGSPGDETQVTARPHYVAYEPSLSPGGQWVVFESHRLDVEGNGVLFKCSVLCGSPLYRLSAATGDCRQPNWSPAGDLILYQQYSDQQWNIRLVNPDGSNHVQLTGGPGDKTDASFSPDGQWIVYSSDEGDEAYANLYALPVPGGNAQKITNYAGGYDGAPSWSPDGSRVAFETCEGDPDESEGTFIRVIEVDIPVTPLRDH